MLKVDIDMLNIITSLKFNNLETCGAQQTEYFYTMLYLGE